MSDDLKRRFLGLLPTAERYTLPAVAPSEPPPATETKRKRGRPRKAPGEEGESEGKGAKQIRRLMDIAAGFPLYRDFSGDALTFLDGEVLFIESQAFKDFLILQYQAAHELPPGADALGNCISALAARARLEGEQRHLMNRVARHDGAFVYNLGRRGEVVVIRPGRGFEVMNHES